MRKICVITGSRADASPLAPVIKALRAHREIGNVGLWFVETEGLFGHEDRIRQCLSHIKPDIVLILGDRYETLVAASVACLLGIPIAHLSGGDSTMGAVDDAFRHAITKLSYWHFPICPLHADRIAQMGEDRKRIFTIGCPSVDLLVESRMSRAEIEADLGFALQDQVVLVCYHPETLSKLSINEQLRNVCIHLRDYTNSSVIITGANEDAGGAEINAYWKLWWMKSIFRTSYSQKLWISLMREADVLIGNSSGFIIEGMTLQKMRKEKLPEIKIVGDRQNGRYQDALRMFAQGAGYPFGEPGMVASRIANVLAHTELPETTQKAFHGLE